MPWQYAHVRSIQSTTKGLMSLTMASTHIYVGLPPPASLMALKCSNSLSLILEYSSILAGLKFSLPSHLLIAALPPSTRSGKKALRIVIGSIVFYRPKNFIISSLNRTIKAIKEDPTQSTPPTIPLYFVNSAFKVSRDFLISSRVSNLVSTTTILSCKSRLLFRRSSPAYDNYKSP